MTLIAVVTASVGSTPGARRAVAEPSHNSCHSRGALHGLDGVPAPPPDELRRFLVASRSR